MGGSYFIILFAVDHLLLSVTLEWGAVYLIGPAIFWVDIALPFSKSQLVPLYAGLHMQILIFLLILKEFICCGIDLPVYNNLPEYVVPLIYPLYVNYGMGIRIYPRCWLSRSVKYISQYCLQQLCLGLINVYKLSLTIKLHVIDS